MSGKSLTRAAILFAGASTAAACGGGTEPSPVVFYGPVPIQDDAGADAASADAATDAADGSDATDGADAADASPVVFYGPTPIQDSGGD